MELERFLAFKVRYRGASNFSGSRILISCKRLNYRKVISYDYGIGDSLDQAILALKKAGAIVKGIATNNDGSYGVDYDTILTEWDSGLKAIEKGLA